MEEEVCQKSFLSNTPKHETVQRDLSILNKTRSYVRRRRKEINTEQLSIIATENKNVLNLNYEQKFKSFQLKKKFNHVILIIQTLNNVGKTNCSLKTEQ
jgi:hypothetical protein